jgi:hypothetical protein
MSLDLFLGNAAVPVKSIITPFSNEIYPEVE